MTAMTHFIFGRVAPGGGTLGGTAGQVMLGAGSAHDKTVGPGAPTQERRGLPDRAAHAVGTKALVMMGGVGDGPGWVASTANATVQATFVKNILDYLVAHDYDGIDIDWEDSLSTAAQQNQLNGFLAALRTEANARARYQSPNGPFILTFPGYVLNVNVDVPVAAWKVTTASLVDQYNLMSYAMGGNYGGWDTWHFSPIFGQGPDAARRPRQHHQGVRRRRRARVARSASASDSTARTTPRIRPGSRATPTPPTPMP